MSRLLEAALAYTREGLPVIPLHTPDSDGRCSCLGKSSDECSSPGKHPRTLHGSKAASVVEAEVRKWWRLWPDANVGVRTGAPGIIALDLDEPAAAAALLDLAAGRPLGGLTIATGRGRQLWYRAAAADDVANHQGWRGISGLDVRGRGGYVVAAPSRHYSGAAYRVVGGQLEHAPDWLYDLLRQRSRPSLPTGPVQPPYAGDGTSFGRTVLRRECGELRVTGEGGRNHKLNLVAYLGGRLIAGGELGEDYAVTEITRAAEDAGLTSTEIAGRDGKSGTLWSGLRSGKTRPLTEKDAPAAMPEKRRRLILGGADPAGAMLE